MKNEEAVVLPPLPHAIRSGPLTKESKDVRIARNRFVVYLLSYGYNTNGIASMLHISGSRTAQIIRDMKKEFALKTNEELVAKSIRTGFIQ